MSDLPVVAVTEGAVGIIELARPEKFNCLSGQCFTLIGEALAGFEANRNIRVILVRAQGKNFCTGADLEEMEGLENNSAAVLANSKHSHVVFRALEKSRLPVIAAVQGLCLAGGLEVMLACDVVFAAESARFGDQHARYGLIPGSGASQRLPRLVGLRRSLDLFYSARWIDAATAESWGLVNHVVPDEKLWAAALDYCATLAKRNIRSISLMKRLAREGLDSTLDAGLAAEAEQIPGVFDSDGVKEGLAAFLERREPNFP